MTEKKPAARKWISLKERADIAGEVRTPEEGAIFVPADRAYALIKERKAAAASAPKPEAIAEPSEPIQTDG